MCLNDLEYRELVQHLTTLFTDFNKRLFYLSMAFPNDPQKYSFVVLDSAPATFTGNLTREFYTNRPHDLLTLLQVIQEQEGGNSARALQPQVEKLRACLAPEKPLYKLFISYRRKSWDFTHRLVADLRGRISADIFVDFNSIDSSDFERSILFHLREADCVLVVVSEHTFSERIHDEGDWMRKEIAEALRLGKPTVLLAHEGRYPPPADQLPPDIRAIAGRQGIRFFPDFWDAAISQLVTFIPRAIQNPPAPVMPSPPTPLPHAVEGGKTTTYTTSILDLDLMIERAGELVEAGRYSESIELYEQVLQSNPVYHDKTVLVLLEQARELHKRERLQNRAELERVEREETALTQLKQANFLVKYARTDAAKAAAREAIQAFTRDYPEYKDDPQVAVLWEQVKPPPPPKPSRPTSIQFLPAPFAWIKIPAGRVTLITEKGWTKNYIPEGKSQTFEVAPFEIAKYPLTNTQFSPFIEAGGYTQDRWWTKAGIEARAQNNWMEPRYWQDAKWNPPDRPVVGVSWYEAVAYCQWLSEVTDEKIRLPTEQEWQHAAQGNTNRVYPWGDRFDEARCNFNTSGTTPVTQYEGKGDSPIAVIDMSGNVWEWCLTAHESGAIDLNGTDVRALRGGSWRGSFEGYLRANYRDGGNPLNGDNHWGLRLARSL